jgi:hypothetical protein
MDLPIPPVLIPTADFVYSYRESWHGDSPFPSKSFEHEKGMIRILVLLRKFPPKKEVKSTIGP